MQLLLIAGSPSIVAVGFMMFAFLRSMMVDSDKSNL
jgi:hypothetical protein